MTEIPAELIPAMTSGQPTVVAGHITPDADCLGSMFALALGITQATGQKTSCALPAGSVSTKLEFLLDLAEPIIAKPQDLHDCKVLAVCDTAQVRRINLPADIREQVTNDRRIINIDHHTSSTLFGDINYVDAQASSTAELICRIFKRADWTLTPAISTLLCAGISADTVGFSLANTTASTFKSAADLVQHGADIAKIGRHLWRSHTSGEFQLRRIVYDNTRVSSTGRIAFSSASYQEIAGAGCCANDIDDQVEIPRSLAGAELAILFTEGHKGKVRINLRSKYGMNILPLAEKIGGGGHDQAAGAILPGTIEDAMSKLIPLAEAFLDGQDR